MFSLDERLAALRRCFAPHAKVEVDHYEGLTINYCKRVGAQYILRGLRIAADFEYERNIALMNRSLQPDVETIFLISQPEYSAITSTVVRDIMRNGGNVSAFVPKSFFQTLFVGSGSSHPAFWEIFVQTLVGPVAAFFTFIGSMGNIPLAAVLLSNGVSFAGIIAFIFSDLVIFPVLRIQAEYYGWKMALYILVVFLTVLIGTAILMHYGFSFVGMLPDSSAAKSVTDREFFNIDYTLFLNMGFLLMTAGFVGWKMKGNGEHDMEQKSLGDKILFWLAITGFIWLAGGLIVGLG